MRFLSLLIIGLLAAITFSGCESSLEDEQKGANELAIERYLTTNKIKFKKDDGVFSYVNHKGYGYEAAPGDSVAFWYVGYTLTGVLFDSNVLSIAQEKNLDIETRSFNPIFTKVGEDKLLQGISRGLLHCRQGQITSVLFPSTLGFGGNAMGVVKPWTPLIFDIYLIYVKNEKILQEQDNINNFVAGIGGFTADTTGLWSKYTHIAQESAKPIMGDTIYAWHRVSTLDLRLLEETTGENQQVIVNDNLIEGLQLGYRRLNIGEAMQLVVPSPLGYGINGSNTISPYTPLFVELRLDSIK